MINKEGCKLNKQEAISIMLHGSHSDKMEYLNFLDIAFDTYNRNIKNSDEVVGTLIDAALISEDDEITDEILEVICSAQVSQNLQNVDYSKISVKLNDISERFLPKYIEILGNTYNKKYLPDILQFRSHKKKDVQEAVRDILIEWQLVDND